MIAKILIVAVLCVAYVLAEPPVNRYRNQRFRQAPLRQAPPRQFFARQEAPYPAANAGGGEPKPEYGPPKPTYGPPPTTTPAPAYGAPPAASNGNGEATNPDSEAVGQPSRLTAFNALPTKKAPQKFSQRLELQQQVKQFPGQQQFIAPVQRVVAPVQPVVAPVQPIAVAAPLQYTAIQPDGSYFVQLPSGSIQRFNYLAQPSVVDGTVISNLQYSPVAEVQASVAEPNFYVNTLVQSQVTAEEEQQ